MITDHEAHIEAQVDTFVDQGRGSYADARKEFGLEVPGNEEFTAKAITERAGNVALTGAETFIEDDEPLSPEPYTYQYTPGSNPKNGPDLVSWQNQSEEQKAINAAGLNNLKAQLREDKENRKFGQ